METTQADLDFALLHIKQLEVKISELRGRIVRLRECSLSTDAEEEQLAVMLRVIEGLKVHVGEMTAPDHVGSNHPSPQESPSHQVAGMTVSDLIAKLSAYPGNARVTLLDPDKRWLLPITISRISADASGCGIDFVAITADDTSDEIEGVVTGRSSA